MNLYPEEVYDDILFYLKEHKTVERHDLDNYLLSLNKGYKPALIPCRHLYNEKLIERNANEDYYYSIPKGEKFIHEGGYGKVVLRHFDKIKTLEIKGYALRILKFLSSSNKPVAISRYISHFIGCPREALLDGRTYLIDNGYIEVEEKDIHITDKGHYYIKIYDKFDLQELFEGKYDFTVIELLFLMNEPVHWDTFPRSLITMVPDEAKGINPALRYQEYIQFNSNLRRYLEIQNGLVSLNDTGRYYYEHLKAKNETDIKIKTKALIQIEKIEDNSTNTHTYTQGPNSPILVGDITTGDVGSTKVQTSKENQDIDLMNVVLMQLNTKPINECHKLEELMNATQLDKNTLEVICEKIQQEGDCSYHQNCTIITKEGKYRAGKGGYKKDSPAVPQIKIKNLHQGNVNTTHGTQSPILGDNSAQTINLEEKAKKWYSKILDEFIKNMVPYGVTVLIAVTVGVTTGKSCNKDSNQLKSPKSNQKNELNKSR